MIYLMHNALLLKNLVGMECNGISWLPRAWIGRWSSKRSVWAGWWYGHRSHFTAWSLRPKGCPLRSLHTWRLPLRWPVSVSLQSALSTLTTKKGRLSGPWLKLFIPGWLFGDFVGTSFFVSLDGEALQLLFGIFLLAIGLQMIFYKAVESDAKLPSRTFLMSSGATIGGVSAVFGVGGGMFTTPLLHTLASKYIKLLVSLLSVVFA